MGAPIRKSRSSSNVTVRNQLVEQHLGLLHHTARSLHARLSTEASLDDLVSAGSIGLMNAAENFDASRGAAFSTFALPRIRGAMLDDLRAQDNVPRSLRRKARDLKSARETVSQRVGSTPEDRDVATELGIDLQTVWAWDTDLVSAQSVSLDAATSEDDSDDRAPWQFVADDDAADEAVMRQDLVDQVRSALETLPAREKQVLALYYFEDLNQQQIAQVLGVTESRVSQLRSQAIARLRKTAGSLQTLQLA